MTNQQDPFLGHPRRNSPRTRLRASTRLQAKEPNRSVQIICLCDAGTSAFVPASTAMPDDSQLPDSAPTEVFKAWLIAKRDITVQAESSAEARRTVMEMIPSAVVTGIHRVRPR